MSNYRIKNTITQNEIDELIDNAEICETTLFGKVFVMCAKLPSGFCITESSACVDPSNYSEEIGRSICLEKIKKHLWELEGYMLQNAFEFDRIINDMYPYPEIEDGDED